MTIDEAIKIKELNAKNIFCGTSSKLKEADRLSIEALKYQQELEETNPEITLKLLPGETEE